MSKSARATHLLRAAEAALDGEAYVTLGKHGEFEIRLAMNQLDGCWDRNHYEQRCLFLCFAAQMVLTGDL